ncbi:DUF6090 family protein [Psychroserpens sp. AS72]|uniref:DUF6090 family protein n=1 Tax=Psychroserpens sp. AS72 TaxID=3135775 RepID=UPI003175476F
MITLLRRFRQRLLSENKFSKYLVYAIGEIILVVIGILIALQINNWNENRKYKQQEIIYLENLKEDLEVQIQSQNIYIDFEEIIIQDCKDIITHYETQKGFHNMDSIYQKLSDLSVRWTFVNANTTLLEMINSGQINLIRNKELKKNLMEFNQIVQRFASNTLNNNTNLIDNLIAHNIINITNYANAGYSEQMKKQFQKYVSIQFSTINDTQLAEFSNQNLNDPKFKLQLINNVAFRNGLAKIQKSGNESLKQNAIQLQNQIISELKK